MNPIKQILCILLFILSIVPNAWSHSSWQLHRDDMMAVFGFEYDKNINSWMKYISSDLIDKKDFHKMIKMKYGINFTSPKKHRYLFHLGYDARPWNIYIETEINKYCKHNKINSEEYTKIIQEELRKEQQRRNIELNKRTEKLFGFADGGKDASFATFFAGMAYDTHILGDYEPDNKALTGLQNIDSLIVHIVTLMNRLDPIESKSFIKGITEINNKYQNTQIKAQQLMIYLKKSIPELIDKAQNESIKRRIINKGFKFKPLHSV